MVNGDLRVAGVLLGDIGREPGAKTKYGHFFDALDRRFQVTGVFDGTLRGVDRWLNGMMAFHPDPQQWKERFYKNLPAFRLRSRRINRRLKANVQAIDAVLQLGVMLDANWQTLPVPSVIYTDYTAVLSGKKPDAGRSPFTPDQRKAWVALEKQALERAAHICTRGEFVRRSIIEDYGIPEDRVTSIGGGVNFGELPELNRKGEPEGPPTVLFIGKDYYRKGGDLLVEAFSRVREAHPDARLRMVTNAPEGAISHLENVEFIEPTWDRQEISRLYREADLFVLPSRLETWGDVLLEAMAYGMPCVGVSGEAMDEIIDHQKTGLIIPPEDGEALSQAMNVLISNQDLRRTWGLAGRRKVESRYTWDCVVKKLAPCLLASRE